MVEKLRNPLLGLNKPSWNIYDVKDNPEYWLAESIATEFVDITGIECTYYIRSKSTSGDTLYGEFPTQEYEDGKKTKLIYEVGEIPTLYSQFGMVATDNIVAHIPASTWIRDVSKTIVPTPGDAIVLPFFQDDYTGEISGRTFEVTHAAHDQSIFQLRSLVHVLYLIPFRFSEQSDSARQISSDISTEMPSISAYGDNAWINEHKFVDPNIDDTIYGG